MGEDLCAPRDVMFVCVCACVCVRERERDPFQSDTQMLCKWILKQTIKGFIVQLVTFCMLCLLKHIIFVSTAIVAVLVCVCVCVHDIHHFNISFKVKTWFEGMTYKSRFEVSGHVTLIVKLTVGLQ